jgi:hypothetical protein
MWLARYRSGWATPGKIPKTSLLHAAAASLRSMDPKLLTSELVANRLVAEHKTLKGPKPVLRFEAARPVVGSRANRCASVGAGSGSERSKD